jgi:hypothetical protein
MSLFPDVFSTPERHTGEHMADVVAQCLINCETKNKVMWIICNNTSNNNKIVDSLAAYVWKLFHGCLGYVRCFAHVLNLVVGVS